MSQAASPPGPSLAELLQSLLDGGMTKVDLVREIGCSRPALDSWLPPKDAGQTPTLPVWRKHRDALATVLGMSRDTIDWLCGVDAPSPRDESPISNVLHLPRTAGSESASPFTPEDLHSLQRDFARAALAALSRGNADSPVWTTNAERAARLLRIREWEDDL